MAVEAFRVKRRLMQMSARFAAKAGVGFNGPTHFRIEKFVTTGLKRMESQGVLTDEARIQVAESNLRRLVDHMAKRSAINGSFPIADEDCYETSTKKLCPLWPFC